MAKENSKAVGFRARRHKILLISFLLLLPSMPAPVAADEIEALYGTWSGLGKIILQADNSENIKCNAYNSSSGNELRLVIRCASTSYKVEVRCSLQKQGASLAGQWEERTYNATGQATGRIGSGTIKLAITGGGFIGKMNVSYTAHRQTVTISTVGLDMKSLRMSLTKSGR